MAKALWAGAGIRLSARLQGNGDFQGMDFWNTMQRCRSCFMILVSSTLLSLLKLLEFLSSPICFSNSTSHCPQKLKPTPIIQSTASQLPTTPRNHHHPGSKCASASAPNPDPAASTPKPVDLTAPLPAPDLAIAPTPPTRKSERASSED
jgi:hypothetical protein